MNSSNLSRRHFLGGVAAASGIIAAGAATAPEISFGQTRQRGLREPVHRVANKNATAGREELVGEHPLDPALERARAALDLIHREIDDYTCTIIKREMVGGKVRDFEYIFAKVRNHKERDGKVTVPFGVYLYFLKPESMKGREVLYIEGENDDKMIAHEAPSSLLYRTVGSVWLKPDGPIAMKDQRYPLTDIGIENLVLKLIERGNRDRENGPCKVEFKEGAKVNGRVCTVLEVKHEDRNKKWDFHFAQIFIDDELRIPIRYAAYDWPAGSDEKPLVLEEYTYTKLKLNVGLGDEDFDHKNKDYNFRKSK